MTDKPRLKFGLNATNQYTTWPEYRRLCLEAEAMGFDSFWVFDHFVPGPRDPVGASLECFTTISALAAITERIALGTLVLSVTYRNPALVAKMGAMVDVLCGGRFTLGIGAGWYELEHKMYGLRFPPAGVRVDMVDEALEVIRRMWGEQPASFSGKHYTIDEALLDPRPVQQPHPPILVGASGDRMLKLVAKHADQFNSAGDVASIQTLRAKVDANCAAIGRDSEAIEHTAIALHSFSTTPDVAEAKQQFLSKLFGRPFEAIQDRVLTGSPEHVIEQLEEYAGAGITHVMISVMVPYDLDGLKLMADKIIPAFR